MHRFLPVVGQAENKREGCDDEKNIQKNEKIYRSGNVKRGSG